MTVDSLVVPAVCLVDDVADVMRFDGEPRERRRHVYALVRSGVLVPIGGRPTAGERLTNSLRFSGRTVVELIDNCPSQDGAA